MDLTPKQQATELIKQASKILIVTGREPNNDQVAAVVALRQALKKIDKEANAIITDSYPKAGNFLDMSAVAKDLTGVRDFVIDLDLSRAEVDKLKYNIEDGKLKIIVTPFTGNFTKEDVSFSYGLVQIDLVIVLGVPSIAKLDRLHEANPTIFDGLHLINIDYHRINENYGSVNLIDQAASSVSEILVSVIESLGQGLIDESIATALLTGIMASTNRFTATNTTPKAMTIAAQLLAGGAKQQDIVKHLYSGVQPEKQPAQPQSKKKQQKNYQLTPTSETPTQVPANGLASPPQPNQTNVALPQPIAQLTFQNPTSQSILSVAATSPAAPNQASPSPANSPVPSAVA